MNLERVGLLGHVLVEVVVNVCYSLEYSAMIGLFALIRPVLAYVSL